MTNEEAIEMISAKKKCLEKWTTGKAELCDRKCEDCDLNYLQGNMGEQIEWLGMAIKALEEKSQYQAKLKKCMERIKKEQEDVDIDSSMWKLVAQGEIQAFSCVLKIINEELGVEE